MRLDLHVHSKYSPDAQGEIQEIVAAARARGLDGVAIVDHNETAGALRASREFAGGDAFLVIRGVEVSSAEGHVLALGVAEPLPRDLSAAETVEGIKALGGVAVAAHPYRFWSGVGEPVVRRVPFTGLEAHNGRSVRVHNRWAMGLRAELGLPATAGSDAHAPVEVGRAVAEVEGEGLGEADVLQAIAQGRARVGGVSRGMGETLRYTAKCVGEWMLRGMRRI